jgi:predicted ATPase
MYVDNLFVSLFEKLSLKTSVVAFFDDVQYFDSSSFEALCFLLERISAMRCLMILGFREDSQYPRVPSNNLEATLNLFSRINSDDRLIIDLNPLIREASAELAAELARDKLTDDEVDSVATRSRGNPFIIDRAIRNLVRVEKSNENVPRTRKSLLAPKNVSDPIRSALIQIQREDMDMRILLDNAAILGEKFSLDELAALTEQGTLELVHYL